VQLSGLGAYLHHQFAHNQTAQKVLLGLTLLMTAMVLGDGVLTPSISGQQRIASHYQSLSMTSGAPYISDALCKKSAYRDMHRAPCDMAFTANGRQRTAYGVLSAYQDTCSTVASSSFKRMKFILCRHAAWLLEAACHVG
jgi:hypothetical protein